MNFLFLVSIIYYSIQSKISFNLGEEIKFKPSVFAKIEKPVHISVVVPVYLGEKTLRPLVERLQSSLLDYLNELEIILVEDRGPDSSWEVIQEICSSNPFVKGIRLSRNFGQHYAITAGLNKTKGEWIIVMDCDLQDRPEEIPKMLEEAKKGYEVVLASRKERKDNAGKKITSYFFFKTLSYLTGKQFDSSVGNFGVYNRKVIQAFNQMQEPVRVFSVMVNWMGFNTSKLEVQHDHRTEGKTGYSFKKRMNLALDIILAYSDKPIRSMVKLGLATSLASFLFACITLLRYLIGDITVSGYTSLILSISFFSGILMMMLGIVGLYVGKIFEAVKGRPLYIIDQTLNE